MSFKYECLHNICYWCGCLTHGDRDYEQWIESKGNLPIESQQYGPWLRAASSTPSRRNMIKVPRFYNKKAKESPPTATVQSKKPPMVVVRTRKLSPEIIRPKKETNETLMPNYTPPDFQEQLLQHSMSNPSNQGTLRNLNVQTAGMGDTKSTA